MTVFTPVLQMTAEGLGRIIHVRYYGKYNLSETLNHPSLLFLFSSFAVTTPSPTSVCLSKSLEPIWSFKELTSSSIPISTECS